MAEKSVGELIAAQSVTPTDLFLLEQNGTAKKLTGQVLENWLVSFADGHGGIQSIEKLSTSGLVDTYRITLADTTTFDFVVTNGISITGISKTSTSGLVDTYTISYNNGTTSTFTVTNGAKGDKGDNAYVWIKYASQEPTESSHSIGDIPDNWIGIYYGNSSTAPTDWQQYQWFKHKGEKGDTGSPATLVSQSVQYQTSSSGTIIPSGNWQESIPVVAQGNYLWTRITLAYNTGSPVVSYSVSRMGLDGSGSVSSVAGISPGPDGDVALTAENIDALPTTGGTMTGGIDMNGQPISGLNDPTEETQAANKGYVDDVKTTAENALPKSGGAMTGPINMTGQPLTGLNPPTGETEAATKGYVDGSVRKASPRNLLDNSDFRNPVNQRGQASYSGSYVFCVDRWCVSSDAAITDSGLTCSGGNFLLQRVQPKNLPIGRYTGAVCTADGTIVCGSVDFTASGSPEMIASENGIVIFLQKVTSDTVQFVLNSVDQKTWVWAALYEGEYTAETLPEYQPKGYAAELAECQRYFIKFPYTYSTSGFLTSNALAYWMYIFLPTTMRVNPTITATGWKGRTSSGYSAYTGSNFKSFTVIGNTRPNGSLYAITDTIDTAVDPNNTVMAFEINGLELSADL